MIFRRRKNTDDTESADEAVAVSTADQDEVDQTDEEATDPTELDVAALDAQDWRGAGPYDISEVDLDEPLTGQPRIDLGSMIVTGFSGAELRLQVQEETETIVSAMLVHGDSALELGAYAAPRSGGLWAELREEMIASTVEAGGSTSLAEGPFGIELRRIVPVRTPEGEEGYQPSRMWVVEGPRWLLRGIVYGQAALADGVEPPAAQFVSAYRQVVVRRGDEAMAPGDLLPLQLPADLQTGG